MDLKVFMQISDKFVCNNNLLFIFSVIKLKYKANNEICSRDIFIQAHTERRPDADKPQGKTLFVINIPPYVHQKDLEFAFADAGPIEAVIMQESVVRDPTATGETDDSASKHFSTNEQIHRFKAAYVIFKQTKYLKVALQKTEASLIDADDGILKTGIEKWKAEHKDRICDESLLQAEVNSFMVAFEEREEEERQEARKPEVDEDGWVTVKRGKNAGFEQKESILKALEEKMANDKKRKEFKNFYTFQFRDSKHKHIISLRKKFEQDKIKIEALKRARRFKPL